MSYSGDNQLAILKDYEVKGFFQGVLQEANKALSEFQFDSMKPSGNHYNNDGIYDRAIQNLYHFIECRHVILWIIDSIEVMEKASYCGDFISMLVLDKASCDVARLLPIKCSKIKQLATAFESCLFQLTTLDLSTPLFDTNADFAKEATEICQEMLSELSIEFHLWIVLGFGGASSMC